MKHWLLVVAALAPPMSAIAVSPPGSDLAAQSAPPPEQPNQSTPPVAHPNLPCFSKVCLGDTVIDHVMTVDWTDFTKEAEAAFQWGVANGKTRAEHAEWVARGVKGLTPDEQKTLVQYLMLGKMDRRLLALLRDRRPVFCRSASFQGQFKSERGYLTSVWAKVTSSGTVRITMLSRQFPVRDPVEEADLIAALVYQYPFLDNRFNQTNEPPWKTGSASYWNQVVTFNLYKHGEGLELTDSEMARQSRCQSTKPSLE